MINILLSLAAAAVVLGAPTVPRHPLAPAAVVLGVPQMPRYGKYYDYNVYGEERSPEAEAAYKKLTASREARHVPQAPLRVAGAPPPAPVAEAAYKKKNKASRQSRAAYEPQAPVAEAAYKNKNKASGETGPGQGPVHELAEKNPERLAKRSLSLLDWVPDTPEDSMTFEGKTAENMAEERVNGNQQQQKTAALKFNDYYDY